MENMTQIGKSGRIVIPSKFRQALHIQPGDEILIRLEDNSITLLPLHQAIALVQTNVKKYAPKGVSLVDELIQERRAEARHE